MATDAGSDHGTVAALAGRRIDALDASESRFPLAQVPAVRRELRALFQKENLLLLICSAACGADLVALDVALELRARCRVVLPFGEKQFRQTSVVDRPGDWGPVYDRIVSAVKASGDLIVLRGKAEDESYEAANEVIVREARHAASPAPAVAVLVWEGKPKDGGDATAGFGKLAAEAGMSSRTILTC